MPRTVGELSVVGEFRKLREGLPRGSRSVLEPTQGFGLRNIHAPKDAIELLTIHALGLIKVLPPQDLVTDHPAIGALSTVLAHPEADRSAFRLLKGEQRQRTEEAVAQRPMPWSPEQLEWQWAQFVATVGEHVPLNPRASLTQQLFDSKPLTLAWNALLDLEVLWAWGLVT